VYQAFYDERTSRGFLHSHSYTGNPLACRAALATLDLFDSLDVLARNRRTAQRIGDALAPLKNHTRATHVRQRGMVWACDAVTADPQFSRRFFARALERELLVRPIGNTVYLMPPYILEDADIDLLAGRLLQTFDEVVHGTV
jgi:adenosylmethionine-8-amino-7-oxononanoate aminotransferase